MSTDKEKIKAYLENRLSAGEQQLRAMTLDSQGRQLPRRSGALVIEKYLREFRQGKFEPRWIAVPGLRGVGKTTLIAQLYGGLSCRRDKKLYLSLDEVTRSLGSTLKDVIEVYEEMLGTSFEGLTEPVYLFIDEVQYDDSWAITLKTIYDRTRKVFIVCTGSSALSLQTNPDTARRLAFVKLYPLSFVEFQMIKNRKFPVKNLGNSIRNILFNSPDVTSVYNELTKLEHYVNLYWKDIKDSDVDIYLKYGTLPSALAIQHEPLIYSQINQTLNSVLNKDVPKLNTFDKETIDKLSQILYAVASYDITKFSTISDTVSMNIRTVISVFEALEKTELLIRVYPYGVHESQVRKPSKFLFSSPAFRSMYYNLVGSTASYDDYKGKLLEDVAALYFYRIFNQVPGNNITYDSAEGGADFILGSQLTKQDRTVVEVSMKGKGLLQVQKTMKKIEAKYGFTVSPSSLRIEEGAYCVSLPLKYFLLI